MDRPDVARKKLDEGRGGPLPDPGEGAVRTMGDLVVLGFSVGPCWQSGGSGQRG